MRRLPPQQRDAVIFVYAEDLTHAEAAAIMGCTEKTVSWHLTRHANDCEHGSMPWDET